MKPLSTTNKLVLTIITLMCVSALTIRGLAALPEPYSTWSIRWALIGCILGYFSKWKGYINDWKTYVFGPVIMGCSIAIFIARRYILRLPAHEQKSTTP